MTVTLRRLPAAPASPLRSHARFPAVALDRPHYESFYLKACHPAGGLGVWIRHTVFKRPGEAPTGSVWVTLFDAQREPVALKQSFPFDRVAAPEGGYISIGDSALLPGELRGGVRVGGERAAWRLGFGEPGSPPPFQYLPRPWMYGAPLPRTKPLLLYPAIAVSGELEVGARQITLEGWPAMIGHNWGSEHPHRGSWIHATGFREQPEARLDAVLARVKVGPVLTPWIANGVLHLGGRTHRLGGLRPGATTFHESPTGARFVLRGGAITVSGEVSAPRDRFVGWRYADPSTGGWHPTVNCSVADMELSVAGIEGSERLTLIGGAAYELQLAEHDHGIPLQPHPDP